MTQKRWRWIGNILKSEFYVAQILSSRGKDSCVGHMKITSSSSMVESEDTTMSYALAKKKTLSFRHFETERMLGSEHMSPVLNTKSMFKMLFIKIPAARRVWKTSGGI